MGLQWFVLILAENKEEARYPHNRAYPLLKITTYAFPILNIFVPQTGQFPCVAGRSFFMVIAFESFISLMVRHFIQYACIVTLLHRITTKIDYL
jgi:hypothetical protein